MPVVLIDHMINDDGRLAAYAVFFRLMDRDIATRKK
jgi:hypothetical protein